MKGLSDVTAIPQNPWEMSSSFCLDSAIGTSQHNQKSNLKLRITQEIWGFGEISLIYKY